MKKNRRWLTRAELPIHAGFFDLEELDRFMDSLASQSTLPLEKREDGAWRITAKPRKKHGVGNMFD